MSFSKTATRIWLDIEDHATLCACLQFSDGSWNHEVQLDLEEFIGNDGGEFSCNSSGFSSSAQGIHLDTQNDCYLVAHLRNDEENYFCKRINLDLHIANNNGQFEWIS